MRRAIRESHAHLAAAWAIAMIAILTSAVRADTEGGNWPPIGHLIGGVALDVAVSADYAYVANGSAMTVVDISTPSAPQHVGDYALPGVVGGVAVVGSYAYLAAGEAGLRVVNVSDPAHPVEVGHYTWAPPGVMYPIVMAVAASGGYAYLACRSQGWNGLRVVDVSNPASPQEVGSCEAPGDMWGMTISGSRAYLCAGGLRIVDITDPTNPTELGGIVPSGGAYGAAVSGSYAYVASGVSGMRVIDVSDPATPVEVGYWDTPDFADNVAVAGSYAYVSDASSGVRVIYVANPAYPAEVGYYNGPGDPGSIALVGTYAYVPEGSRGLRVLDVSDPAQPISAGVWDAPAWPAGVAVAEGYAYVADAYDGLRIVDVADPTHPSLVSTLDMPSYASDVAVVSDYAYVADSDRGLRIVYVGDKVHPVEIGYLDTQGSAEAVVVVGSYAYVTDDSNGLLIVDVSSPSNPLQVGHVQIVGNTRDLAIDTWNECVFIVGSDDLWVVDVSDPAAPVIVGTWAAPYLADGVAFEEGRLYLGSDWRVYALNVTDPTNPVELGYYDTPATVRALAISSGRLFVADSHSGLRVLDAASPSHLVEIGYWDTPGESYDVAVDGMNVYLADAGWGLADFPATMSAQLSGQVRVRGTGAPIPDAIVRACRGENSATDVADDNGIYGLDLAAGQYNLAASAPGYVVQTKPYILLAPGQTVYVNFNLDVSGRVTGQVRERVTNINLAGAQVDIYSGRALRDAAIADATGIYTFDADLPTGTYTLVASKPGYVSQTKANIAITAGQTTYVNFFLDQLSIKGQVRVAGTGAVLAGATVAAIQGDVVKATMIADAAGIYQLLNLAPGPYTVVASKEGYVRQGKPGIGVSAGATTYANFSLSVSGILKGQVKDKVSGAPVVGATVQARSGGVVWATATATAPYAVYEIKSDLPAGTFIVSAGRSGYLTQTKKDIVVSAGATTNVNFNLDRGPVIKGQVREAGTNTPVAEAEIMLWKDQEPKYDTFADASGVYEIPSGAVAEGGPYDLIVLATGYLQGGADNIYIAEGETQVINVSLQLSGRLAGQVKDKLSSANLGGARVEAYLGGDWLRDAETAEGTGIYEMTDSLPGGVYVLKARADGHMTQTKANITVTPGVTTYVNFSLDRSGMLSGQVRDAGTSGNIEGAVVQARLAGVLKGEATSSPTGIYELLRDLPVGTYVVSASKAGYVTQTKNNITVTTGVTTYVNFSLQPQ